MYPAPELKVLAARKGLVRARISLHRLQCSQAGGRLAEAVDTVETWAERLRTWATLFPLLSPFLRHRARKAPREKPSTPSGKGRLATAARWGMAGWRLFQKMRS